MKIFYFVLFVFSLISCSFAQDLPHYLTPAEKEIYKTYSPPEGRFNTAPPSPVRTMAEWEELRGTMITWISYTTMLRSIVDYAQDEGLVYIVCSDSNSVKSFLTSGGVPLVNLRFLITSFNSVWCRDYGPWTVYKNDIDSMYIIDWIYNRPRPSDDVVPVYFANYINKPIYQTTASPNNLTNTGGNFMTDGNGTGFASRLILNDNPSLTEVQIDTIMKKYMGLKRYIKMVTLPYDNIHHIDMHMKLLDEETIMVGQYPAGIADGPQIEANLQYILNNFLTCYGRPYKVVRIPMPPDGGLYPHNGGDYRTYTNSVFVNKTVLVPTYEYQYDTTALRIYREALPGYRIVGIESNASIGALGAIHCITKEVGVDEPIFISHAKLQGTVNSLDGYEVKALIKSKSGISNAYVYWSADTSQAFNSSPMTVASGDTFKVRIPQSPQGTKLWYYISANTVSGRSITKPITAPQGRWMFTAGEATPVELLSFNAAADGKVVNLYWSTATELNNKGFEIEKCSGDVPASKESSLWKSVTFISGAGNSTIKKDYIFTDKSPNNGKSFYRLKQIDVNGIYTYTDAAEVIVSIPNQFALQQNYPNPFNPSTLINFSIPEDSKVKLEVFNIAGEKILELLNEDRSAGYHAVVFNSLSLSSGVYYYRLFCTTINGEVFTSVKKMMVLK